MKKIFLILSLFISIVGFSQTKINTGVGLSIATANDAIQGSIVATETSANVYAGSLSWLTNVSGKAYDITFPTANTGSTTFNLNTAGAVTLKKFSSGSLANLASGDISAGETKRVRYNGTFLVIEGGAGSGGTVTSVSGTANQIASTGGTTPVLSIVTSPILPGSPTIASPGNSTQNIITTDATQTLSNKTMVTPNLGTPSAINLTNATSPPTWNQNTSGTAANLSGTPALPNGTTATTQSATDNSTKLATTAYADSKLTVSNTQTSNYTFALTDVGKVVRMNLTGTANTLTIPPNSSVAFPLYTWLYYEQVNTGITTLTQGAGVTLTPPAGGSLITPVQGIMCAAYKTGTDTWEVYNGNTVPGQSLTKVDDTNITLTLGGSPTTSLLAATSITAGWNGLLSVPRGGTGTSTQFTDGSVVFAGLAGVYSQDNATLFWDRTNKRLGIGNATPTSKLELSAGSTSANSAPIELNTGARETTPRAGIIQYTTPQLFFTNGGLVDQEIQLVQQSRVSTQFDATSNTTLANITGLTSSLAAGKTYRFSAYLYTTSNVAGGVKFAIAGTATATSIIYEAITRDATTTAAQTRASALATAVGGATAVTAAYVTITGLITCNAAGTMTVQFAQNASSGTASSVLVGSNFEVNEML